MDEGRSIQMKQAHTWREDEEVKTSPKAKIYARVFYFAGQDAIEYVVRFRIDSHNKSKCSYLVPLGIDLHAYALDIVT